MIVVDTSALRARLGELEAEKNSAIAAEHYERAGEIRDEISALTDQLEAVLGSAAASAKEGGDRVVDAEQRGRNLVICVSDTGIGIAPEDIDRVMQPFVQLENHLQRRYEGTGLGLSLVKAMVELHGGSFRLLSEAGFGTTAVVTLPPERVGGTPAATFAKQPERRVRNDRLVAS